METKFTKGPWKLTGFDDFDFCIESSERSVIVAVFGHHRKLDAENENKPNAHLIAAAPEMYKFLDDLANGRGADYPIEQLLAKARGEHE